MKAENIVFLDTSIQFERFIGSKRQQENIENELKKPDIQFVTSNYTFMEFQRSVLSDFVYIYNQVLKHDNWEDVAYMLRSGQRSYKPRSLGRCLQIFTWTLVQSNLNRERALDFLEIQITQDVPGLFWRNISPIEDTIICDLVKIGLQRQVDNNLSVADSCRKATASCSLPEFLIQSNTKLQRVVDYLSINPGSIKKQEQVEKLLANIIVEPRNALGQSTCWPLGDLIIALQVPDYANLWTLDADFGPLGKALGLPLYTPTYLEVAS